MASSEATKAESKAPEFYAFEFALLKDKIGEKTTNPQVKSKVSEAFMGYGAFTETQVLGAVGTDRTVIVFFARLFGKGQPALDKLKANESVTVKIYDEEVEIKLSGAKPSGGGATTGTSSRPKKETAKAAGRGKKPAAADKPKEGVPAVAGAPGAVAPKDGEKKDAKDAGRGRGRGKKEDEPKGPSLQRGRANIGGKLGPISKVRLAKAAKEAREKENILRVARGEEPLPDPKAKGRHGDDDDSGLPPKKEAGKKDAGKKEGGKKEAGKAPAKAAAPKKK
jgi:hypothetical protein